MWQQNSPLPLNTESVEVGHEALEAAGYWGVPKMVFVNEPFSGQDRMKTYLWAMEKAGLQRRWALHGKILTDHSLLPLTTQPIWAPPSPLNSPFHSADLNPDFLSVSTNA